MRLATVKPGMPTSAISTPVDSLAACTIFESPM